MTTTAARLSDGDSMHRIRPREMRAQSGDTETGEKSDSPDGAWFEAELHGWRLGAVIGAPWLLLLPVSAWLVIVHQAIFTGTLTMPPDENIPRSILLSRIFNGFLCFHAIGASLAVFYLAIGKVEVVLQDGRCRIFTGVGPVGWTESVDWDSVQAVEEGEWWPRKCGPQKLICLSGSRDLRFGRLLTEPRRRFLLERLQQLHDRSDESEEPI